MEDRLQLTGEKRAAIYAEQKSQVQFTEDKKMAGI